MALIVLLPGDGVGPEVLEQARLILEQIAARSGHRFTFETHPIGGAAIDAHGSPLPEKTLDACRRAQASLLGAVGGPKWERAPVRPEHGLLELRQELGLFANLRPVRAREVLLELGPVRESVARGTDLVIVRELIGGLFYGERHLETREGRTIATDVMTYGDDEVRRIAEFAFRLARRRRKKVTSVDKANVLDCSRLWRKTVEEVALGFPDVTLVHGLVDAVAMQLIASPTSFDVILTENLFGDILSDEAAVLAGSIGLLPSASLSADRPGLYEPLQGATPNPIGAIESAAMLLRWSLGLEEEARAIEEAVDRVLVAGVRTRDLGGTSTTSQIGAAIRAAL